MAGIAAMGVAAVLGMVMELNNTAIFTSSCVAYVAVSMWTESRIAKRRSQLQDTPPAAETEPTPVFDPAAAVETQLLASLVANLDAEPGDALNIVA